MGFADAGKLGVPIRPRVYSDKLPKNVAQEGVEGAVFEIGGINPETFNIEHDLHAKIVKSEYFKCLYVFKTFDKVVDLVYEKVTYVEPWTHRGTQKRGFFKCPSSAFCLLLKLFHLRLTEDQVRGLLDHPDSTYIRALGMLYVRYGADPTCWWRWLGEYLDDLEESSPGGTRARDFKGAPLGLRPLVPPEFIARRGGLEARLCLFLERRRVALAPRPGSARASRRSRRRRWAPSRGGC